MHLLHDLRLVVDSTRACLAALQRRSVDHSLPPELDYIHHLLETCRSLVDEELVSRTLKPIGPHVELNAVLRDLGAILAMIAGPAINVRLTLGDGDTRVFGQRSDLERIILNVAHNALSAMPSGGTLSLDTEVINPAAPGISSDSVRMTIHDTGRGMSEDKLLAAIDPMAKPRLDGTGFGLPCVATIVARLGGRLEIESKRYQGTLVTIVLPLVDS